MNSDPTAPESDLGSKAKSGFALGAVGILYGQIVTFVLGIFAARLLGADSYALVVACLALLPYVDVVLDAGLGASVIFEQEAGVTRRVQVAFTMNLALAVVLTAILVSAAPLIASFFQNSDAGIFRLVSCLVLIRGLNQIPDSLLRRDLRFRRKLLVDMARPTLRLGVSLGFLLAGFGPVGFVSAMLVAECAGVLLVWALVQFRQTLAVDRGIARELFAYSGPVLLSRVVGQLSLDGDYFVVGHTRPKSDLSAYYSSFRLPQLLIGPIYYMFSSVAFPVFAAARNLGPDKLKESSLKALRYLTFLGFSIGCGLALVSRDFVLLAFGEEFRAAIGPMQLLSVAAGFAGIGFASGDIFMALGKTRLQMWFSLALTPLLLGGFVIAAPHGILAVAAVHVIVLVPYSMFRIAVTNRLIGTTWASSLAAFRPAAATVAGMAAVALPVRLGMHEGLAALVAIGGAGTVGAAMGLWFGARSHAQELLGLVQQIVTKFR